MSSAIEKKLADLVAYTETHPSNYIQKQDGYFNDYRDTLNEHLRGVRGKSLFFLIFKKERESFEVNKVRLGLTPACPWPLRKEIIAQHNYRANENRKINKHCAVNSDSIRVTNLMAAIFCMPLSLTYRLVRAVFRLVFLPITYLYALHQEKRYGVKGWAVEDLRRIGWEWLDLGATFITIFAGIINVFHPNAIKLDHFRGYYIRRIDGAISKNIEFAKGKLEYLNEQEKMKAEEKISRSHLSEVYD